MDTVSLRIDAAEQAEALARALDEGTAAACRDAGLLARAQEPLVRTAIWEAMRRKVDFDLFDWLAEGWTARAALRKLKDEPGPVHHGFGSHAITGALHPVVTLTIGTAEFTLRFTVTLIADFDAVMLTLAGGRITEFVAGACAVSVQAGYGATPLGASSKIASFTSPFRHALKPPGLAIP